MRVSWLTCIFLGALITLPARAEYTSDPHKDSRELYRGARALAMGNSFVSIADDEEALFYNPAGLAGIDRGVFQLFNNDFEISGDIVTSTQSSYSQFSNLSGDALNVMMGKDFYLRGTYLPTYVTTNFGFGVLLDQQLSLIAQNKALPQIEFGYQATNGIQMGYGFSITQGKKARSEIRFGIGLKYLFRRGGYHLLTQQQAVNMSKDEVKQIVGDYGKGFGGDLGTQYIYRYNKHLRFQAGAAWTQVGGVQFDRDTAEPIPGNLSAGVSVHYELDQMGMLLTYDMRHITQSMDSRLKNHFGTELNFSLFNFYAGVNGVYPTFGAGIDLRLIQILFVSYAEEMSSMAKINPERRYLLHFSLGF